MARSVNFVWNFVNELSHRSIKERGVFLSVYDMHPYTKGAGKELGLHSQILQCIADEYVTRRKQFKKARLNWRKSGGARRSLGDGVEGRKFLIQAPLQSMSKAAIIRHGTQLGVDYAFTVCCYQTDDKGQACGVCDSCQLRKQGF